ncbi:type III-B CRISPR module-associated protein Cmr5 [Sulfolobus tengchongensis]|uniref:CRISPR type III-B/RAMP module-associated protein Cmr5 n=1 Tax=Sulfolobus tengchongensis TaxID=207809 RepID=A0AAX4L380_9CREN
MESFVNRVMKDFSYLSTLDTEIRKKIRSRVRELPTMISTYGLRTTMYFYYSKATRDCIESIKAGKRCDDTDKEAYGHLFMLISNYIKDVLGINTIDSKEVLKTLSKIENEIMAEAYIDLPLNYLKRLVEAEFEKEEKK